MADELSGPPGGGPPPFPAPRGQFPPPTGWAPATGIPYASWWTRVGASLIDGVMLYAVQALTGALLRHNGTARLHYAMRMRNGTVSHNSVSFLVLFIGAVFFVGYATVMLGSPRGQTVGMMAVGVRARTDERLGPLGPARALRRSLVQLGLAYTVVGGLLDVLWPLWDAKNQTLHDKAVGSVVVVAREAG